MKFHIVAIMFFLTILHEDVVSGRATRRGRTYVGFVVDNTGSMGNEISGVKSWITSCATGGCGAPTGGWITTTFNDPTVGSVVGPTTAAAVIATVNAYSAYGGGDCPELAFTGLQNVLNAVPTANDGCKIYFFTDASAKDTYLLPTVWGLFLTKGCAFIPILTGCCYGACPKCISKKGSDFCSRHFFDDTGVYAAPGYNDFYTLAENTGGNVYLTNKPSHNSMVNFLKENLSLGFCSDSGIAGPFECETDCLSRSMCWDRSVGKCYCKDSCEASPMRRGESKCSVKL